jgi:3-oxoacyl-[acyl-carrier protein] reductase
MDNKVAVITGTSSGLGHAMALSLLERGYTVFGGSRNESSISHDNFIDLELDVRDEKSVINFYHEIARETEVIDLLINNAGICDLSSFQESSSEELMAHFQTNTMGTYLLLKYLEPFIIAEETQVLNILSVSAKKAYPNTTSFTVSEQGKRALISVVEKEFKKYQVRFQNFYIGAVDTELWNDYETMDVDKMLSVEDFLYVFNAIISAPTTIQFPDVTFLHKDGFLD